MSRLALAILTFADKQHPRLTMRLDMALWSLERTGYSGEVVIVDDGSNAPKHLEYLERLSEKYRVVRRKKRGGVARAKNTCLRCLAETDFEFGFIAEDDILFRPGWAEGYVKAHEGSGIQHFSWASNSYYGGRMRKRAVRVNNYPVMKTSMLNGVLLTVTPEIIRTLGGFRIGPHYWGHEHTNFTRRCVKAGLAPFFADIVYSNSVIGMNKHKRKTAFSQNMRAVGFKGNRPMMRNIRVEAAMQE